MERMRMLGVGRVLALGVLSGLLLQSETPAKETATPVKRRIAVFPFDNAARPSSSPYPFLPSTGPDAGKAASDLLITRLVRDGLAIVVERDAISKLLAEQNSATAIAPIPGPPPNSGAYSA